MAENVATYTTRPVLSIEDLDYICEGLLKVANEYADDAKNAARAGDLEDAGGLLAIGQEVEDLRGRLDLLKSRLLSEFIDARFAEAMADMRDYDDESLPTGEPVPDPVDEVGTVPLTTVIAEVEAQQ